MPGPSPPEESLDPAVADDLLAWYRRDARDLPWRRTDDPYAILVSEFMLQQTRVETVRSRFGSFLERFPDLESLAAADPDEVLAEWSGLGYYRRARSLHACARRVVEEMDGELPRDPDALEELPGLGPYTAGAVASIAFGRPAPALDGNVARVLSRLVAEEEDPRRSPVRRRLRQAVRPLLAAADSPGDLNQALMELGARICRPRTPRCLLCPVSRHCRARAAGLQAEIPPARESTVREVEEAAAIVERRGRYLLLRGQRPGVLQGMWEFPTLDSRLAGALDEEPTGTGAGDTIEPSAGSRLRRYLEALGWPVRVGEPIGEIRHGISGRRIRCRVFRAEVDDDPARRSADAEAESSHRDGLGYRERGWFVPADVVDLPLAASARKTISRLLEWEVSLD